MLDIKWHIFFCIFTFLFMTKHSGIRAVATPGAVKDGSSKIGQDDSQETIEFLLSESLSHKEIQTELHRSKTEDRGRIIRIKRSVLYPSGVKICTDEDMEQAITDHVDYFHLRVCQETVWEAFKIFWDRLPDDDEFQDWTTKCQEGRASTLDIATNFSKSAEHLALLRSRVPPTVSNREDSNTWQRICSRQDTEAPSEPPAATTQREEILWPESFAVGHFPETAQEVVAQEVNIWDESTIPIIQAVTVGPGDEATLTLIPETSITRTAPSLDNAEKVGDRMVRKNAKASVVSEKAMLSNDIGYRS